MDSSPHSPARELNSRELLGRIRPLCRTDNATNWLHLGGSYLFLALVIGGTIAFYHERAALGLAWLWNVAVTFVAVQLIGIGQHRLVMLGHEASHYLLFRHRLLNELASDWLC